MIQAFGAGGVIGLEAQATNSVEALAVLGNPVAVFFFQLQLGMEKKVFGVAIETLGVAYQPFIFLARHQIGDAQEDVQESVTQYLEKIFCVVVCTVSHALIF